MQSTKFRRLFRFNVIRPVRAQIPRRVHIEYNGPLTEFLTDVQSAKNAEEARSLAVDQHAALPFFQAGRLKETDLWPLIDMMLTAYSLRLPMDISAIKERLLETAQAHISGSQMRNLAENVDVIWDHYVVSLLVRSVSDRQRAALVDCLKAIEIYNGFEKLDSVAEFRAQLSRSPVLPGWLVQKIAGTLNTKLPFVAGVSDLMVVEEKWELYERGEIAQIENVMASEHRTRTMRQLDRTEVTTTQELETTESTTEETSSSIHSSVANEVESTLAQSTAMSAGATVSASYGPAVKVDTSASFDFNTTSEETAKSAQEYAQDVVESAVANVTKRERSETVTVVLSESEDTKIKEFTNTSSDAEHIVGVYRHLDQVWRAQVFNYGRRLMLDLVVPEPSINWLNSRSDEARPDEKLEEPRELDVDASQITVDNYQEKALEWGATKVPAPPDGETTVSKSIDMPVPDRGGSEANSTSQKVTQLPIPEGYRAVEAKVGFYAQSFTDNKPDKDFAKVLINGRKKDIEGTAETIPLQHDTGTLEFGVYTDNYEGGVVTVRIKCEVSPEAWAKWQNDVYDELKAANDQAIDAYNAAKKNEETLKALQQETLHPDIKRSIERDELKRAAISILTEDNFADNGSVELAGSSPPMFPETDFPEAKKEGKRARFLEEAFEWEQFTYLFYPYFWARRSEWYELMNQRDPDFDFNAFLSSGSARANLAVRPGFEAAVLWFLATGEVWMGGPVPVVGDALYVALVDEIAESKGRTLDQPIPVGESWTYAIPTQYVVLDPDDRLIPPPAEP